MHKYLFTYLLAFVLVSSILVPTCLSFCEVSYELSIEIDSEEETEKIKEIEIKILDVAVEDYKSIEVTVFTNNIIYFPKKYTSIYLNLDSPPPKFTS